MITSLNVVFPEKCGKIRGFFNRLRGDKVCVEIKRARGVSVKQLTYICRRQKVNLNKMTGQSEISAQDFCVAKK